MARLDSPTRLAAFRDGLLAVDDDEQLQGIARDAAEACDAPIGLVSLVMGSVQVFRAAHGLPAELEVSRATNRCDSFCQFVVEDEEPLLITDSLGHERLPQTLVGAYSIRAYLGAPVRVGSEVLGSVCVLSLEPRTFTPAHERKIVELAAMASKRLEALAGGMGPAPEPSSGLARSIGQLDQMRARVEAELGPLLRLGRAINENQLSASSASRALGVLGELLETSELPQHHTTSSKIQELAHELQRSNRDLARFASFVSHDLKEPLRMVSTFVGLLERRYAGQLDETANRYIDFALDGAKRMQAMLDGLLEMSQIGRSTARVSHFELTDAVTSAQHDLRTELARATVTVPALPKVYGNPGQLTQVFKNLLSNAAKYRSERPLEIEITVQDEPRQHRITVTDNGIGFDPEHAARIFELFQRLHPRDEGPKGTGVGLAIVARIVELHRGTCGADSTPGRGTTMWFTIPKQHETP